MIEEELKNEIKEVFPQVTNTSQLVLMMEILYKVLYPNSVTRIKISERTIRFLAFKKKNRYKKFEIAKKSGGSRAISAPIYSLKVYQFLINVILQSVFEPNRNAFGFIPGKSIVDNAKMHIGKKYVYNIDLEAFFPSIHFRRVKTVLGLSPFNLINEREELAFLIANLCCEKENEDDEKGYLPQGAPTSPTITNIICQRLDRKLSKLAKKNKATYTRYADDITFSSDTNIFNEIFYQKLLIIIEFEERFKINEKKVRLQNYSIRQEVTGVIVNRKPNLSGYYIDNLRFWIFLWEKFGYEKALARFNKDYNREKGFSKYAGTIPTMIAVVRGKLDFLGMVKGRNDSVYINLKDKISKLLSATAIDNNIKSDKYSELDIEEILNIWLNEGIENAASIFYNRSI